MVQTNTVKAGERTLKEIVSDMVEWDDRHEGDVQPQQLIEEARSALAKPAQVIDVIMEGGIIQDVLDIPEGVQVRVIDYDVEGSSDDLEVSPYDGNDCTISVWEKNLA